MTFRAGPCRPCSPRALLPWALGCLMTLLAAGPLQAKTLEVVEDTFAYSAGRHIEFLEDRESSLSLTDILNPPPQLLFQPSTRDMPGFGFSRSSMWGRLTIKNTLAKSIEYFLVIDYPPLDYLDFYSPTAEGYQAVHTGDQRPFASRPIRSANYVFPIHLGPGQQATYYLRCQTSGSLNLPIRLESPTFYAEETALTSTMLGIYYGILLVMTVYITFLYLRLRDIIYGYYVLFIFGFLAFQVSLNGTGFQHLWPTVPWWNNITVPFFIFLSYTSAIFFTITILDTQKHIPRYHKILRGLIPVGVSGMLVSIFADYSLTIKLATLSCLTLPVMIIAGIRVMMLGYRPAYYYALAWTVSLLAITLYSLKTIGVLPNTFLITWSTQIGTSWEVMILALAVADRFHIMEEEKKQALEINAAKLEEANIKLADLNAELEERIASRTQELKKSNDLLMVEARERRLAEQAATKASRTKSEFLANMSHEIRTPMNAIIGMSVLALQLPLSSRLRGYVQTISRAGTSLMRIIDDILDFSKIEAGKLEFERVAFNLQDLLDNLANIFNEQVQEKGIELLIHADRAVPRQLVGDPLRLEQVLINLIGNGIKFTDQGQVALHVSCPAATDHEATLHFAVADTGIGLSRQQTLQLFTAFQQGDTSITRKYGGTGLGLAICQKLASMMQGSISVTSEMGQGSTFLFTARLVKDPAAVQPPPLMPPAACAAKTILVAHHNSACGQAWQQILVECGFQVRTLADLEEIPAFLGTEEGSGIDMLLTDLGREPDRFFQVVAALQAAHQLCPITLALTDGQRGLRHSLEEMGVSYLLAKPVNQQDLISTMGQCLGLLARREKHHDNQPLTLPNFQNATILVAEDNKINQQVISEILANAGCQILLADDGRQALDLLAAHADIACILMDLQMPVMDGIEATRQIRRQPRHQQLPIIALTAHSIAGDREKCLAAGMDDYVPKPIDQNFLYATMATYLRHHTEERVFVDESPNDACGLPDKLPGFHLDSGLKRVGRNKAFYRKLLHDFGRQFAHTDQQLQHLLEAGAADQAKKMLHAIRGVAANLSAATLERHADELERHLDSGEPLTVADLAPFNAALAQALHSIATLPEATPPARKAGSRTGAAELPMAVIMERLEELQRMLATNDLDAEAAVDGLIDQLGHLDAVAPLLDTIKKHLDLFDFTGAGALVGQLAAQLAARAEK
jgi:signal transduction histidine kinase/CheY-like chemotaxis protein